MLYLYRIPAAKQSLKKTTAVKIILQKKTARMMQHIHLVMMIAAHHALPVLLL